MWCAISRGDVLEDCVCAARLVPVGMGCRAAAHVFGAGDEGGVRGGVESGEWGGDGGVGGGAFWKGGVGAGAGGGWGGRRRGRGGRAASGG